MEPDRNCHTLISVIELFKHDGGFFVQIVIGLDETFWHFVPNSPIQQISSEVFLNALSRKEVFPDSSRIETAFTFLGHYMKTKSDALDLYIFNVLIAATAI
jgi:hypothetical protein